MSRLGAPDTAEKRCYAASRHSYRWCSPPTHGSATTFAAGDGRGVTGLSSLLIPGTNSHAKREATTKRGSTPGRWRRVDAERGFRSAGMSRLISLMTNPSFLSSAWMRGAPQPSCASSFG